MIPTVWTWTSYELISGLFSDILSLDVYSKSTPISERLIVIVSTGPNIFLVPKLMVSSIVYYTLDDVVPINCYIGPTSFEDSNILLLS